MLQYAVPPFRLPLQTRRAEIFLSAFSAADLCLSGSEDQIII
jgi:hypothetical protein